MSVEQLNSPRAPGSGRTCNCSCPCCGTASLSSPLKRKLYDVEREGIDGDDDNTYGFARVGIENEAVALREALAGHQLSIQELSAELEEERSAASTAATEAMSMILRLQHEKAQSQMEARQYKRFVEEKMAHDQQEIVELEDLLYRRDQMIQALNCEVQAYQHRLRSFGIGLPGELGMSEPQTPGGSSLAGSPMATISNNNQFDVPTSEYPPLKCKVVVDDTDIDLDKYPFGETPREQLQQIDQRIYQLERMPSSRRYGTVMDKGVVGQSPYCAPHLRSYSMDSYGSGLDFNRGDEFPESCWRDDMSDRVYTVDTVHGASEHYISTPREALKKKGALVNEDETEIKKLYARLQTLEADRESMKKTIIAMNTEKTQVLLMKEIAQYLCNEKMPEKKILKKAASLKRSSLVPLVQCIAKIISWRRKPSRVKHGLGLSSNNSGLLLLLDKSPRLRQRKYLNKSQGL